MPIGVLVRMLVGSFYSQVTSAEENPTSGRLSPRKTMVNPATFREPFLRNTGSLKCIVLTDMLKIIKSGSPWRSNDN